MNYASPAAAQQLLDRVLVRVNGEAITKTDVDAAIGLGIVDVKPGEGASDAALRQLVDRRLLLTEIARFPPQEPTKDAVDREVQQLKARVGARLPQLERDAGLDESRIRDLARDSLRIRAYLEQRFGSAGQVDDNEVRDYYQAHPEEFQRNGVTIPFEDAEPAARERAAAARRTATVAQWMNEIRGRADIVTPAHDIR